MQIGIHGTVAPRLVRGASIAMCTGKMRCMAARFRAANAARPGTLTCRSNANGTNLGRLRAAR